MITSDVSYPIFDGSAKAYLLKAMKQNLKRDLGESDIDFKMRIRLSNPALSSLIEILPREGSSFYCKKNRGGKRFYLAADNNQLDECIPGSTSRFSSAYLNRIEQCIPYLEF